MMSVFSFFKLPAFRLPGRRKMAVVVLAALVSLAATGCRNEKGAIAMYNKGRIKWERGEFQEAARNFIALAEVYPESTLVEESLFWAGNLYQYFLNQPQLAERYYQRVLLEFPKGDFNHSSLENLALLYEANSKKRHRAILLYKNLIKTNELASRHDYFQFRIAQIYMTIGRYTLARYEFTRMIHDYPGSIYTPEAYYLVGYSYYIQGQENMAQVAFRQISKDFSGTKTDIRAQLFMADILENQGKMDPALKIYKSLEGKVEYPAILTSRIKVLENRMNKSVR